MVLVLEIPAELDPIVGRPGNLNNLVLQSPPRNLREGLSEGNRAFRDRRMLVKYRILVEIDWVWDSGSHLSIKLFIATQSVEAQDLLVLSAGCETYAF